MDEDDKITESTSRHLGVDLSTDGDATGVVIAFPTPRGKETVSIAARTYEKSPCGVCQNIVVSAETRTVTCRRCGKVLDAFDVLYGYATKQLYWRNTENEMLGLSKQLSAAKEELRRTVEATKRFKKKDIDAAVAAERKSQKEKRFRNRANAEEAIKLLTKIINANRDPDRKPTPSELRCGACHDTGSLVCDHARYEIQYAVMTALGTMCQLPDEWTEAIKWEATRIRMAYAKRD